MIIPMMISLIGYERDSSTFEVDFSSMSINFMSLPTGATLSNPRLRVTFGGVDTDIPITSGGVQVPNVLFDTTQSDQIATYDTININSALTGFNNNLSTGQTFTYTLIFDEQNFGKTGIKYVPAHHQSLPSPTNLVLDLHSLDESTDPVNVNYRIEYQYPIDGAQEWTSLNWTTEDKQQAPNFGARIQIVSNVDSGILYTEDFVTDTIRGFVVGNTFFGSYSPPVVETSATWKVTPFYDLRLSDSNSNTVRVYSTTTEASFQQNTLFNFDPTQVSILSISYDAPSEVLEVVTSQELAFVGPGSEGWELKVYERFSNHYDSTKITNNFSPVANMFNWVSQWTEVNLGNGTYKYSRSFSTDTGVIGYQGCGYARDIKVELNKLNNGAPTLVDSPSSFVTLSDSCPTFDDWKDEIGIRGFPNTLDPGGTITYLWHFEVVGLDSRQKTAKFKYAKSENLINRLVNSTTVVKIEYEAFQELSDGTLVQVGQRQVAAIEEIQNLPTSPTFTLVGGERTENRLWNHRVMNFEVIDFQPLAVEQSEVMKFFITYDLIFGMKIQDTPTGEYYVWSDAFVDVAEDYSQVTGSSFDGTNIRHFPVLHRIDLTDLPFVTDLAVSSYKDYTQGCVNKNNYSFSWTALNQEMLDKDINFALYMTHNRISESFELEFDEKDIGVNVDVPSGWFQIETVFKSEATVDPQNALKLNFSFSKFASWHLCNQPVNYEAEYVIVVRRTDNPSLGQSITSVLNSSVVPTLVSYSDNVQKSGLFTKKEKSGISDKYRRRMMEYKNPQGNSIVPPFSVMKKAASIRGRDKPYDSKP